MDRPVALIPLVCIQCSIPIPAQPEEVAWVCTQCGQCQALDDEQGLAPLEIHYAAGIPAQAKGKPFWVAQGQARLVRKTYSGDKGQEAEQFWSQPRRFFIPAFSTSLDNGLELANRLLLDPPDLKDGQPAAFEPVVVAQEDVRSLAEFVVMSVEAARSDKLKELQFSVELSLPVLWVLP